MSDCKCVYCGDCRGFGQVEVQTGGYPEWDLESCSECWGSGVSELCESCNDREEFGEWPP